jgi:hypothetical protein
MMIKRIVALSAVFCVLACPIIAQRQKPLPEADIALIKRALAVYRDLHAGKFEIRTTQSSISNGQHVLTREMIVAGQTIRWIVRIPVEYVQQKSPEKKNRITINAGSGISALYTRDLIGPLILSIGGMYHVDKFGIQGGVGLKF